MSGQDSIRGYLFQSLIALLKSLNNDWLSICVEPNTENDKIDIIWTFPNEEIDVCQVKSSINNFSTNDILRWLEDLKNENIDSKSYIVYLVGNSTASTKSFFNSIESKDEKDFPAQFKDLFNIKSKISVLFEPNNLETLEEALISGLDRFLFTKDISADYPTKKLIANGMVNQIFKISTSGKTITKKEFEDQLLDWLKYNYSNQILINKASFELKFHHKNATFSDTISKLTIPDIKKSHLFKTRLKKIKKLFGKIEEYNFEVKTFEKEKKPDNLLGISALSIRSSLLDYEDEPVIIDDFEKSHLDANCLKALGTKPDKEFYNFGTLLESKKRSILFPYGQDKTTLKGLKTEKEKKELYDDFNYKLYTLIDLMDFWKKISKFSLLPIILTNTGKNHQQDIKIQLFFPKNLKIANHKNFPKPKSYRSLKNLNSEDSYLFKNIKHSKSSLVKEYYSGYVMPPSFELGITDFEQLSNQERKYRDMLDYFFDYDYHKDNPDKIIIECMIDELNTNEKIALPSYLFIKSKKDFVIEYKITCKNEPEASLGKLYYKASS